MRFRTKLDDFMWYITMALPLLAYLIQCIHGSPIIEEVMTEFTTTQFMSEIGNAMQAIGWTVPQPLLAFAVWVASVWAIHLVTDLFLLLPRILQKVFSRMVERGTN